MTFIAEHLWKISTSFCIEEMPLTQRFSSKPSPSSIRDVNQKFWLNWTELQSASIAQSQGLLESVCQSSLGRWAILQLLCSLPRKELQEELTQKLSSKPCGRAIDTLCTCVGRVARTRPAARGSQGMGSRNPTYWYKCFALYGFSDRPHSFKTSPDVVNHGEWVNKHAHKLLITRASLPFTLLTLARLLMAWHTDDLPVRYSFLVNVFSQVKLFIHYWH